MNVEEEQRQPLLGAELVPVYPLVHQIRQDIMLCVDSPLSYADMTSPELSYSFVRPLEEKYAKLRNPATVFCLLLNRVHFLRDQHFSTAAVSQSRATLCEILAIRILLLWTDILDLAYVLVTSWPVFSGADADVMHKIDEYKDTLDPNERVGNAIELAILSNAKRFIKSRPCRKVTDAIWTGKLVYSAESSHAMLADNYKRTPIHLYDPRKAPLLNHYRLKVPAVRSVIEYLNFIVLFTLFVIALEFNEFDHINIAEGVFMVYALGFTLEKVAAMQEHGVRVYFHGTWNGFDVLFITIYLAYASLRLHGTLNDNEWSKASGTDCLALAACLMFPRLAFVTLSDNLMILALRSMFYEFIVLMALAAFCFTGFLYSLWTLSRGQDNYSPGQITWWMLSLWFGLGADGFERSTNFHPIFGPILMVTYACLSNTLLLTVLVSILSHTFSTISSDAEAEAMYRRCVATIEGVKADYLFSYLPPLNMFALLIMLPARYILSPRWFHKINVTMIRVTSFAILLLIAFYDRHVADNPGASIYDTFTIAAERVFDSLPRRFKRITIFEGLAGSGADIDAVFDIEEEVQNENIIDLPPFRQSTPPPQANASSQAQAGELSIPITTSPERNERPASSHEGSVGSTTSRPRMKRQSRLDEPSSPIRVRRESQRIDTAVGSPLIRLRRDSHQNGEMNSPLTQLFQPIIVDDDVIPEEPGETLVPLGPIVRRRLTSMTRHRRTSTEPNAAAGIRWPASRVDDTREEINNSPQPMVSPEAVDEMAEDAANIRTRDFKARLEAIESRQQNIENLLKQLVSDLQSERQSRRF